jgi:hypothetical protein
VATSRTSSWSRFSHPARRRRRRSSAPPPKPAAGGGAVERLEQLAQLRDTGLITAEEFEAQKLRILEAL